MLLYVGNFYFISVQFNWFICVRSVHVINMNKQAFAAMAPATCPQMVPPGGYEKISFLGRLTPPHKIHGGLNFKKR